MDDSMTVTIGSLTFDHATYDDRGDVLYLHAGEPRLPPTARPRPRGTSCASTTVARSSD
jgi:hypothetical protein